MISKEFEVEYESKNVLCFDKPKCIEWCKSSVDDICLSLKRWVDSNINDLLPGTESHRFKIKVKIDLEDGV